ncbi:MAG: esterase family protein [Spirochaetaceae bacterium]|jgi:S-formylglutathione hydrolase FrmB|nr:esterase family protein [Spirochaetaceae bacterium]
MALMTIRFRSAALKRTVSFAAIVPLDKILTEGEKIPEKFRTLYLLHGYTNDQWEWFLGSTIEEYAHTYNMAIILPSIENSFYLDDAKREAYYAKYIGEELISWTRRAFPLSDKREDTLIGGLSMGGFGAIRNGLYYNEVFGGIMAMSSALITDEVSKMKAGEGNPVASYDYYAHTFGSPEKLLGSDNDPKALAEKLLKGNKRIPKIYMACGTEDFLLEPNRDMHRHLEKLGIEHKYEEGPGEHNMKFFNPYLARGLAWYFV